LSDVADAAHSSNGAGETRVTGNYLELGR